MIDKLYLLEVLLTNVNNQEVLGPFYYDILGFVLNFFENDEEVYNSIFKISYVKLKDKLKVIISIGGSQNFRKALDILLKKKGQVFTLNKTSFLIEQIGLTLEVLDLSNLLDNQKVISKFTLNFMSPTMIRNRDFIYVLPVPEKFLVNPIMKIKNICQIFTKKDIEKYKHFLREYVLVNQFKIKTEKIVIKKSERAGVVGNVRYVVKNLEDNENNKLLNITLKLIKFLGVGSGTRLGLGNVDVKIIR